MNYNRLLNMNMFKEALVRAEKEVYLKAFEFTRYNQTATAKLLGVSRNTFRTKMSEFMGDPH